MQTEWFLYAFKNHSPRDLPLKLVTDERVKNLFSSNQLINTISVHSAKECHNNKLHESTAGEWQELVFFTCLRHEITWPKEKYDAHASTMPPNVGANILLCYQFRDCFVLVTYRRGFTLQSKFEDCIHYHLPKFDSQ